MTFTCANPQTMAAKVDHTVLSPAATEEEILAACALAREYGFRGLFTNPYWCPLVAEQLVDSNTMVGISAAFPMGSLPTAVKVQEVTAVLEAIQQRVPQRTPRVSLDVVANTSLLKDKNYNAYTEDLAAVGTATKALGAEYKVIIETSLLTDEEISIASTCAAKAGAHIVKTSTGRNGPPRLHDISLMRQALPENVGIKFSGFGVHNGAELAAMALALGAEVLGSPQGNVLVETLCTNYKTLLIQY